MAGGKPDSPYTGNLQYLTDLQGLSDDLQTDHIDWDQIVDSMAKAIAAGNVRQMLP